MPPLLVLTDRRLAEARGRTLVETVAAAVDGGARAVVLREKDLPRPQRAALAARLALVVHAAGGLLLAASDPALAPDGVHLAAVDPPHAGPLVGRSCHVAAELAAAARVGCAYATVSPVATSPSKPGYGPPLGLDGLARLVAGAGMPVYALGGVTPALAAGCRLAGAAGVAVLGAVMGADDPRRATEALLGAWDGAVA